MRAPTLVLHGTDDPFLPYGHGVALAAEIPGARLIPLAGAGHEPPPRPLGRGHPGRGGAHPPRLTARLAPSARAEG